MNTVWIGLIGTLSGVLIGGIVSYFVSYAQFNRDKKLKEQQIIQQKLEEICETAEGISRSYTNLMSEAMMFIGFGKKMQIKNGPIPFNKLKMLIYFYAPGLKEIYNQLYDASFLHSESMIYLLNSTSNDDKKAWLSIIRNLNKLMTNQCTALIEGSANIIRGHFENKTGYFKEQIKN